MRFAELMASLQGDRTQQEFADLLGISQQTVSAIARPRLAGRDVLTALIAAFPSRRAELVEAFLAQEAA